MKPTHKTLTTKKSTNTHKRNTKQTEQEEYGSSKVIIIIINMHIYGSGGIMPLIPNIGNREN